MKITTLLTAAAFAATAATSLSATTIDLNQFDAIYTEGYRTQTVDGQSVANRGIRSNNGGISSFEIPGMTPGQTALVSGYVSSAGTNGDTYTLSDFTGALIIDIMNLATAARNPAGAFGATFELLNGGVVQQTFALSSTTSTDVLSQSFAPLNVVGANIALRIFGTSGTADYDVSFSSVASVPGPAANQLVAAVPVPAAGLLLFGALGGLTVMRRRRKTT